MSSTAAAGRPRASNAIEMPKPDKLRGLKPLGEMADRRMRLPPHEAEVHTAHAVDALAMRDLGGEHQGVLGACTGFVDLAAQREDHGQVRRGSGSMFEPQRIEALQRESQQLLGRYYMQASRSELQLRIKRLIEYLLGESGAADGPRDDQSDEPRGEDR